MAGTAAGAAKARSKKDTGVPAAQPLSETEERRKDDDAQKRLEARFGSRRPTVGPDPTHYVVARRPLKWQGLELMVGEVIPNAEQWPRKEAWVRAGLIAPQYGEVMTSTEPPVEEGQPEDLPENEQSVPEDDDPESHTGEPLEDESFEEVSK